MKDFHCFHKTKIKMKKIIRLLKVLNTNNNDRMKWIKCNKQPFAFQLIRVMNITSMIKP